MLPLGDATRSVFRARAVIVPNCSTRKGQMKKPKYVRRLAVGALVALAAAFVAPTFSGQAATLSGNQTSGLLPKSKILLRSALQVNLSNDTVRLPLHKGRFNGRTVWYVITEASDFGLAHDLNVNYAPKLYNMGVGCPACVQEVSLRTPPHNKFHEGIAHFEGIPNFKPSRVLTAGPHGFPPKTARPGAVGGAHYSPFIRIRGSRVVYNAPIVATGKGPFDVVHHSNTADRVLAVHRAEKVRAGQFSQASVDLLLVHGFDASQPILYISTESSDPVAATLERATYVPLLNRTSFLGGDDFLGSARERIFPFANGQTGPHNPQSQGLAHLILDGHASQDASLRNKPLINALRTGGDALNIQGDFPSLADPRHANAYSPLWDAQIGQWTKKAVRLGLNKRQTDENRLLNLVATRPDLITGVGGAPFGATGFVINCPVIGFTNKPPTSNPPLVRHAQG